MPTAAFTSPNLPPLLVGLGRICLSYYPWVGAWLGSLLGALYTSLIHTIFFLSAHPIRTSRFAYASPPSFVFEFQVLNPWSNCDPTTDAKDVPNGPDWAQPSKLTYIRSVNHCGQGGRKQIFICRWQTIQVPLQFGPDCCIDIALTARLIDTGENLMFILIPVLPHCPCNLPNPPNTQDHPWLSWTSHPFGLEMGMLD